MTSPLRAFMVCVDYSDLLALTLPYNVSHFKEVNIITSSKDKPNVMGVLDSMSIPSGTDIGIYETNAFYKDGAVFNKWRALEEGLDSFGRDGWICLMDADVLWPKGLKVGEKGENLEIVAGDGYKPFTVEPGYLCSPLRRMYEDLSKVREKGVPLERDWSLCPIHRNVGEWAGYTQIFHSSDPVLEITPWHEIDFISAGTADSFFQMKWSSIRKVRPPFEVLHLGPAGENWLGRATPYLDGSIPKEANDRKKKLREMLIKRRQNVRGDKFAGERISRGN